MPVKTQGSRAWDICPFFFLDQKKGLYSFSIFPFSLLTLQFFPWSIGSPRVQPIPFDCPYFTGQTVGAAGKACSLIMDLQETQRLLSEYVHELASLFHRIPGSAIVLRYIKSSYQNDPVRSAVELFLFLFAVRYLLASKYSTKPGVVQLSEDEIDDLVDEWTPEPLVSQPTALEAMEVEKRPVIVRYGLSLYFLDRLLED